MEIFKGSPILFELHRMHMLPFEERPKMTIRAGRKNIPFVHMKLNTFFMDLDLENVGIRQVLLRVTGPKDMLATFIWKPEASGFFYSVRTIEPETEYQRPKLGRAKIKELSQMLPEGRDIFFHQLNLEKAV